MLFHFKIVHKDVHKVTKEIVRLGRPKAMLAGEKTEVRNLRETG